MDVLAFPTPTEPGGVGWGMKCVVIVNARAGRGGQDASAPEPAALRAAFAEAGVEARVRCVAPDRLESAVRAALADRPDAVVMGGGDGTIRTGAAVLAGTDVTLGVLPLGTLNHFAKDLKIPTELKAAVTALARGVPRLIDLGEVNGHVFINNCSLGAYAETVRRRDALQDVWTAGKWRAMARASWETFRRLRLLRLRLSLGREPPRVLHTPLVVIGNNRYSGSLLKQNLRPRLDEGVLWLYTVNAHRHLAVLRLMLRSLVRRLDEADTLTAVPATGFVIEALAGKIPVAADGEVLEMQPPFRFRIRPRALQVLAPAEGAAAP